MSKESALEILRKETQKKKRHMPVRALLGETGDVVMRLTPCFLMSPISVAQYLDPRMPRFDLVIFDEASQIPAWEAIGAIASGCASSTGPILIERLRGIALARYRAELRISAPAWTRRRQQRPRCLQMTLSCKLLMRVNLRGLPALRNPFVVPF